MIEINKDKVSFCLPGMKTKSSQKKTKDESLTSCFRARKVQLLSNKQSVEVFIRSTIFQHLEVVNFDDVLWKFYSFRMVLFLFLIIDGLFG